MSNKIDKINILVESEYLNVIYIAGRSGNLALTTIVYVNTKDNTAKIRYTVRNWNDKLSRLNKSFTDYTEAHEYHAKLVNKFSRK